MRVLVVFVLLLLPSFAHAQKRVALVIGNSAYQHTPKLTNPKNDAADVAAALKAYGFQVVDGFDLDKPAFDRKVRDFATTLKGSDVGLFFYAGHGLQVRGHNYLVPIDAKAEGAETLDFEMVRVDVIHRPAVTAPARLSEAAEAWGVIKDTTSIAALDAYVARFKDTFYAELARQRLEELRGRNPTPTLPKTNPTTPGLERPKCQNPGFVVHYSTELFGTLLEKRNEAGIDPCASGCLAQSECRELSRHHCASVRHSGLCTHTLLATTLCPESVPQNPRYRLPGRANVQARGRSAMTWRSSDGFSPGQPTSALTAARVLARVCNSASPIRSPSCRGRALCSAA